MSSLSSFDQLITNYDNPKTKVSFTSDIGIKMEVDIEIHKKNDILIHIEFYYKNTKMHYGKIDSRQLTLLVGAYEKYATEVPRERSVISLSWSSLKDPKSIAKVFGKITKIKKILQRYRDLHSVNVFTILRDSSSRYPQHDYILARTTIELDADIITIIPPELLLITDQVDFLMNLHSANVHLANYLFLYPLAKTFAIVKLVKNIVRILSIPIWISLSFVIFPGADYIFSIINFIGIPAVLFKSVPRIMSYILKKKLT